MKIEEAVIRGYMLNAIALLYSSFLQERQILEIGCPPIFSIGIPVVKIVIILPNHSDSEILKKVPPQEIIIKKPKNLQTKG